MTRRMSPQKLDLNLLKVFRAVYETGQTRAAANALGLTQPAVSQALGRLRAIVGDPLFVATRSGMEATARAHELARPLMRALDDIFAAIERAPLFDPATAKRRFRLGMLDYGVIALAPAIALEISRRAPGIVLEITHVNASVAPQLLMSGQIDLATGPFRNLQSYFIQRPLFQDVFAVVARKGHPRLRGGLDIQAFTTLGHVEISYATAENDIIDRSLRGAALARHRAIVTPHFIGAFHIVGGSDLIAVAPRRLAEHYRDVCALELHVPPLELPALEISSVVHRRNEADMGLAWLLRVIETAARGPLSPAVGKQEPQRQNGSGRRLQRGPSA